MAQTLGGYPGEALWSSMCKMKSTNRGRFTGFARFRRRRATQGPVCHEAYIQSGGDSHEKDAASAKSRKVL